MRSTARGLSGGAVCALALMSWMCNPQTAAADNAAAEALADKFSRAAEDSERASDARQAEVERARAKAQADAEAQQIRAKAQAEAARRRAAEQRAADEADMLRNAEAEAQARRAHDQKAEAARIEGERQAARAEAQRLAEEAQQARRENEQRAEEVRKAEAARLAREVEEQRIAEEKRLQDERRVAEENRQAEIKQAEEKRAEEARQAAAARRAREAEQARVAEEKRLAEEKKAEEARQAEAARLAREAERARIAEQQRQADEGRLAEERAALEAKRMEEAQRIAEKFRLAREARERDKEARSSLGGPRPEEPSPFIDTPATAQATYPARATVLLIIQPRRHGFGGVRMTANPVLCLGQNCYISGGAEAAATLMPRMQTLGPGNTLGRQAGACREQVACVFRGVELGAPSSQIQPVDMGFLRHDRKEVRSAEPDRSCDVSTGRLYCSGAIVARGYRAWIVPEIIADKAGPNALERALDDGLPMARSASSDGWGGTVHALPNR